MVRNGAPNKRQSSNLGHRRIEDEALDNEQDGFADDRQALIPKDSEDIDNRLSRGELNEVRKMIGYGQERASSSMFLFC